MLGENELQTLLATVDSRELSAALLQVNNRPEVKVFVRNQSWHQGRWELFGTFPTRAEADQLVTDMNAEASHDLSGYAYEVRQSETAKS